VPAHRPFVAAEDAGYLPLARQALFYEVHHRVGFTHAIACGEVRQHHPADANNAKPIAALKAAALVDLDDAIVPVCIVGKQVILVLSSLHRPTSMPEPDRKNRTVLGPHPEEGRLCNFSPLAGVGQEV
jgi:hypothetical protein